jgi:GT2 family glycosyltransferase
VEALILTFDAPAALERCLAAVVAASPRPHSVLVVDNASPEPVDHLVRGVPGARVLRLDRNTGPAGGHAAGFEEFLAGDADWLWVLDDDCVPAPGALGHQLALAEGGARVVMATMHDADTGAVTNTQGWCAVLIAREVVETVGVPDRDLFWWTEDTEYLQWRIPRAGFGVERCPEAVVEVSRGRGTSEKPAWKYYYEARNQVYYRLYTQHVGDTPLPRHLRWRVRAWRVARSIGKLAVRALVREHRHRIRKLAFIARGTVDGLRGRLGATVAVDDAHRPEAASRASTT